MAASAAPGRRAVLAALLLPIGARAQEAPPLVIGYLSHRPPRTVASTLLDPPPADEGVQGAQLGLADTATTGRFTGQRFALEERRADSPEDALAALQSLAASGSGLIVADLPGDLLRRAAELPEAAGLTLLNIAAPDDALRNARCRRNLLHILPSRAMLTDALAQ